MNSVKATRVLLTIVAALVLVGCSYQGPKTSPGTGTTLANTYWKLLSIDGAEVTTAQGAREAHLILRPDFRVDGFGGCNSFSGTWQKEGDQLSVGPLLGTLMSCENIEFESELLANFNGKIYAEIEGEILTVIGSNGSELIFRAMYFQ